MDLHKTNKIVSLSLSKTNSIKLRIDFDNPDLTSGLTCCLLFCVRSVNND